MRENSLAPSIRFDGFTDAWEQRKVSEIGSFSKGTGYSKSDIRDKGTPLILYGRLYTKYETVIRDVDTFTTPKDGSVYSRGGEVIIPASGETAEDISIASVVEKSGVILGGDLNIVTPQSGIDSAFLALSISHGEAHRSLSKLAQGKSVVHIHNSDIQTVEVGIPVQAEQEAISQFFEGVDGLITLHQRKYEKLMNIKKSMLEKMFPKNGELVPEVRFDGFTDAWEQRKLGEVCGSLEYGLNAAAKEYDGENKYIRITDIDDNTRLFMTSDLTSPDTTLKDAARYRLEAGDIVFARTGASVGKSYIYKRSDGTVYYAGFLIRAKVKQEYPADFVFQNTLSQNYEKYILITSQRSGQPGVNAQEYAEYTFSVPEYEEQKKIGTFLTNLDTLITLHQRKLEKLNNIKKSFLEKMFI